MTDPSKGYRHQEKYQSPEELDARILAAAKEQAATNAENKKSAGWNWMPVAATAAVLLVGITFVFNTNNFVSNSTETDLFSPSVSNFLAPELDIRSAEENIQDRFAEDAAVLENNDLTEPVPETTIPSNAVDSEDAAARAGAERSRDTLTDPGNEKTFATGLSDFDGGIIRDESDNRDESIEVYIAEMPAKTAELAQADSLIQHPEEAVSAQPNTDSNEPVNNNQLDEVIVTARRQERSPTLGRAIASLISREEMEPELIEINSRTPEVILDIRYAGADNFIGEPIDGYQSPKAVLSPLAAEALAAVQNELAGQGLSLKIFDAYRPQRAVDHFLRWSQTEDESTKETYYPNIDKSELFDRGYLAERSSHSRGSTVDLTIVRMNADGSHEELDMGTIFDFFDSASWPASTEVSEIAQQNRQLLRDLMMRHGFEPFATEWWHFTLKNEPFPDQYFDVPLTENLP